MERWVWPARGQGKAGRTGGLARSLYKADARLAREDAAVFREKDDFSAGRGEVKNRGIAVFSDCCVQLRSGVAGRGAAGRLKDLSGLVERGGV